MKVLAIVNPRAGLRAHRALELVRQGRPRWSGLEVDLTERPGHARELSRAAAERGVELVLAVGGDGTANEVAEGLLGSPTVLGLVPMGSGNGLARVLGIPLQPHLALPALEAGTVREMDLLFANGRPVLNVAGAGFDAEVGADFQAHGRRGGRRGIFTYVRLALQRALRLRARRFVLELDGAPAFDGRALLVAFLNGRQYGGGAVIAPGAFLDDGVMEVVIALEASPLALVLNAPRLFFGTIERFRAYRRLQGRRALLRAEGPFAHHRDGEPEPEGGRVEVEVRPRALRILVPEEALRSGRAPFAAGP